MNIFSLTTSILFFAISFSHASNLGSHIIDHKYPGCPTNSACTIENGVLFSKWNSLFKKKGSVTNFKNGHGIPLSSWGVQENAPEYVHWDSACEMVRKNKIYPAQIFLKSIKNGKNYYFPKVHLSNNRSYLIPRGETPIAIDGKKLHFNLESDGNYFSMQVFPDGVLDFKQVTAPENFPKRIECPKNLIQKALSDSMFQKTYEDYFCKAIWDMQSKRYISAIFGKTCN